MGKKPVLSIGIIFKNEIRCLERCLKSFDALRRAIPCEVVMADTGSDDGSREVAQRYADILIDFPWIDDFAAARNAVLDQCSGMWFFAVDADEWLDEDISELTKFLKNPKLRGNRIACAVLIRNYMNADLRGDYTDFMASRMFLMSTGIRYEGTIHEHWSLPTNDMLGLGRTILHHDGYVGLGTEKGAEKRERNMKFLRRKLADSPRNLIAILQCIESSIGYELEGYIRRGMECVREKERHWEEVGPPIFRYAASYARAEKLPELTDWCVEARELFPKSLYTRIDISFIQFGDYIEKKEYANAIPMGEEYLAALADYRAWRYNPADIMYSTLAMISSSREIAARIQLASAYFYEKQPERAWKMFRELDVKRLDAEDSKNYFGMLLNLYAQSGIDTSGAIAELWDEVSRPDEEDRKTVFLSLAAELFSPGYRNKEAEFGFRHACDALLPLAGKCGPGTAARILNTTDPAELQQILESVKDLDEISIYALAHALEQGVQFPLPGRTMRMEETDRLARRLTKESAVLYELAVRLDLSLCTDEVYLDWARALTMAAVRTYPWKSVDEDDGRGLALARVFAGVFEKFLPLCYSLDVLREARLFLLPPMHRFGWYCVRAFDALNAGDAIGYVLFLRTGLASYEGAKPMVEFLTEHTPELQLPPPSPELLALAEQVRTMLAAYDPNDLAVATIKQSPVYQRVAYLIEGNYT